MVHVEHLSPGTLHHCVKLSVLCICLTLTHAYTQPSSVSDLHKGSTATSTTSCRDDSSCENSVSENVCNSEGTCTLSCPPSSRTSFPSLVVLTKTNPCPEGDALKNVPSAVNGSNGNFFTNVSHNEACTINNTVNAKSDTGNFGLSFWIQGMCSSACTVFRVGPVTVKLNNNSRVEINNQSCSSCIITGSNGWTHVVITRRLSTNNLDIYIDDVQNSFSFPLNENIGITEAVLGPNSDISGTDSYTVLDARFYSDGLTTREIGGLQNGTFPTTSLLSECRCPVSKPDISSDGLTCGSDTKRLQKTFNTPAALLDGNSSSAWTSKMSTTVVVSVNLLKSFQITNVEVSFHGTQPSNTKWEFLTGNTPAEVNQILYDSNTTQCRFKGSTITTYKDFSNTIATGLKLTFTYGTSSRHIIKSITITGRCDCDGSATRCSKPSGTQAYTCTCLDDTKGDNCKRCVNGKFRQQNDFGCLDSCGCHDRGVNMSDKCESVGGACKCKMNVEGERCDTCKHLTYNLSSSNPDGCTRSSCNVTGSISCNNVTGVCQCQSKVIGEDCDRCETKHYDLQSGTGCKPCNCMTAGTVNGSDDCNIINGECQCKINVQGRQCNECKDGFHNLSSSEMKGCTPCGCNSLGTNNMTCDKRTGQCSCRDGDFHNLKCRPIASEPMPNYGPISGGTVVRITGHYLDSNTLRIHINENLQNITKRNDTFVEIITGDVTSPAGENLKVSWLGSVENFRHDFVYKPNPVVDRTSIVERGNAARLGGCTIGIKGDYLNSVAEPIMHFVIDNMKKSTVCTHVGADGKMMRCPTPPIDNQLVNGTNGTASLSLDGITLDNVTRVIVTMGSDVIKKDYEFAPPFEKKIKITGSNLGSDCEQSDYFVYIGSDGYPCTITSFSQTQLECEPPATAPADAPARDERLYDLIVRIGTREITVGNIYYKQFWLTDYFIYIMVGGGLFLIVIMIIGICICCYRCKHRKKREIDNHGTTFSPITNGTNSDLPLIEQKGPTIIHPFENPSYTPDELPNADNTPNADEVVTAEFFLHRVEESIRSSVKASIVGASCFKPGNLCVVKGNHARLIDGTFTAKSPIKPNSKVTIKMLKDPLPENGVLSPRYTSALRECLRLKQHTDDNVLSILGIGLDKKRFYIIYPYMEKKTLKDHIVDHQQNFVLRQLLEFALQVCEGMEYLSSRSIVHKDIATRNCMIDATDNVKISDSAFSWDFYPDEYLYDSLKDRYLPVRWMAPESLTSGFYDTKSDVWAFGVLVWELLTRGCQPFHELRDEQVRQYVKDGYRLGKPLTVSDEVYESINSCWYEEETNRPTFLILQRKLEDSLTNRDTMNEDLYVNAEQTESIYINQDEIQRLRQNKAPRRPRPYNPIR